MTKFIEPVTRKETTSRYGKASHHYVDGNGTKLPGVTTILSDGIPKPALIGWGIKTVAEYAVDHWDELADADVSERLKTLKGAPYADRDKAARRGTEVHALAEQLVHGVEVDVPEELAGHVEAYVRFLDDWSPTPVLVERTVYNLDYGWAGTLDLVADMNDGRRLLMDVKTTRSGVYGETAFQLAMYRYATHYLDDEGKAQEMPPVDDCAVIWVRADGYALVPVRADESVLLQARYIARVAEAAKLCRAYVGEALAAPVAVASWTDLEVYQPPTTSVAHWAREAADAHKLATALVKTSFVPAAYKGKPDEAAACIVKGAEMGLTPMAALSAIHVISGTPALSALALRALVQAHGHTVWIEKSSDKEAIAKGRRRGEDVEHTSKWTIGRANQLGLMSKANWKSQPEAMLIARATSEVCRMVAADALLGVAYSVEELSDDGGEVTQLPPPRTAQRAKRKAIEPAPMVETDEPPLDDAEPVAEPPPADEGITRAQMTKLHAAFGNVGWSDRADRLRAASLILGRPVTTSAELTKTEAHTLITEVEALATADDPSSAMTDLLDTLAGAA